MLRVSVRDGWLDVERLAFDSEIFGFEVGRVAEVSPTPDAPLFALHEAAVERAREAGFAHLSRRVAADDRAEIAALERARYYLTDVAVVFDHDLRGVDPSAEHPGVRVAGESDIERVVATCTPIFRGSRYYHDPVFSAEGADEVHRRWIWNSYRGRADAVLVLDDPLAFVTCAVDGSGTGSIALFGVAPGGQRRGAGQRLLAGALSWFARRAKRVEVKTQSTNYAAARMYERGGFRLFRGELTYARRIGS